MLVDDIHTLVSPQWLDSHIDDANLKLIDASWYLPDMQRNAHSEYSALHIPGALFFDIDTLSDNTSDLPHMAPSTEVFAAWLCAMGISNSHQVVVYDGMGLFSAARVWWLFKVMGLDNVAVLDGGLPKWISQGRNHTKAATQPEVYPLARCIQRPKMMGITQVLAAVRSKKYEIIDARAPGRFLGIEPEPRKGLRAGHIPGSKNVFFKTLLHDDNTMKSPDDLRVVFEAAGVDMSMPVITSCGSGITAAIINLALAHIGSNNHFLYDGSWAEWGMSQTLPIEIA